MNAPDPDISALNLTWLIKARELARTDPLKAAVVLGLDRQRIHAFATLSIVDLHPLAHTGCLVFKPRFDGMLWREIVDRSGKPDAALQLHLLLATATEPTES